VLQNSSVQHQLSPQPGKVELHWYLVGVRVLKSAQLFRMQQNSALDPIVVAGFATGMSDSSLQELV